MANVYRTLFFLLPVFCNCKEEREEVRENDERCEKLGRNPFFYSYLVSYRPWRVYHMWQKDTHQECVPGEIYFTNFTPQILMRIKMNMQNHLQQQPNWETASLVITTGKDRHEIVLLVDQRPGTFVGVPNLIRRDPILPVPNTLPLKKYQMKLLSDAKTLAIVDCLAGLVWLFGRPDVPPSPEVLSDFSNELDLGHGAKCSYT